MDTTAAHPVIVGHGHDTHLTWGDAPRTYCGRQWTADTAGGIDITCRACRKAYAQGRHPKARR